MKKIISVLLVIVLALSLCACGRVDIGPITFNFDRLGGSTNSGVSDITPGTDASTATPDDPIEAPPMEEPGESSVTFHSAIIGNFSERGYPEYISPEGASPYLLVTFSYTGYESFCVDYIDIGGNIYFMADPYANPDHFVNNIERYLGYEYAYDYVEPTGGSVKAFACFHIEEQVSALIDSGEPCYISFGSYSVELTEVPVHTDLLDELLAGESDFGYSHDTAHAGATLLWALDFSHYLIQQILMNAEMTGDTGVYGDSRPYEILPNIFYSGSEFSPFVTPNLNGTFEYNCGIAPPFYPENAYEIYPELVDMTYEYAEICMIIAELSWSEGNFEEIMEYIYYANDLYYEIMAFSGREPYDFY